MKLFKNICAGVGLLSIVGSIFFFVLWLFYSIGKTGVITLSFAVCSLVSYLKG